MDAGTWGVATSRGCPDGAIAPPPESLKIGFVNTWILGVNGVIGLVLEFWLKFELMLTG